MIRKKLLNKIFISITISLFLISFTNSSFGYIEDPVVILETNLGNITIEFFPNDAPNHIDSFLRFSNSGFYDGTLFHRIIPGFMIQGGDPNTKSGDPNTWGTGGPNTSIDAEFNSIKHNRGIVSMARSADPNSAGSQFFIVHKDSNFLDGQYTVFGRIVTDESFDTLDKIAAVDTEVNDRPTDPDQVKIIKTKVVSRSEISNILELPKPERTGSTTQSTGNQKFESEELGIIFSAPEGWLLQEPDGTQENSPTVVAVGPKIGVMNPVISLTVQETNQRTLDDLILEKNDSLKQVINSGQLKIISQQTITLNGKNAYVTNAQGDFSSNDEDYNVKFREVMIYDTDKYYTFAYSNGVDDFDSQLLRFEETINSFEILSKDSQNETSNDGGGCLIATATYGSEMSFQVQQLRELRDNSLLQTESGTSFMNTFNDVYYSFSPVIADYERENPVFKELVKITITPMISSLSILNHVSMDSEIEVVGYGISLILLNVGMYFGLPATIIYKIRK